MHKFSHWHMEHISEKEALELSAYQLSMKILGKLSQSKDLRTSYKNLLHDLTGSNQFRRAISAEERRVYAIAFNYLLVNQYAAIDYYDSVVCVMTAAGERHYAQSTGLDV